MPIEKKDGTQYLWNEIEPYIHENKPFLIAGNIIGISEIENFSMLYAWKCTNCSFDDLAELKQSEFKNFRGWNPVPKECPDCGGEIMITQNTKEEVRKVTIQEPVGENLHLRTMQGFIFGKNAKIVQPSQDTHFEAVLRSIYKKGKDTYQPVLDVYRMKMVLDKKIPITAEDIDYFKTLEFKDIIDSFCPKIKGCDDVKEGLLLCMAGGIQEDEAGLTNAFLLGDPATGKTEMLKFATEIVTKSDYTSGRSASAAGLVAGLDNMADGTRQVRFGPVVNCNNGIVCIDEMDKMIQPDQAALHECMSKHTYSLKKVGVSMTLPTNTLILGAANPVGSGKWQVDRTIKENIKLSESLISRFGLIFLLRDLPNMDKDRDILRQMVKSKTHTMETKLDVEGLKKYLEWIKETKVELSGEAIKVLEDWFLDLRQVEQVEGAVAVDARAFNDLVNLSAAYAKYRKSDSIDAEDANNSIKIFDKSLKSLGMNTPSERTNSMVMDRFMDKESFTMMIFEKEVSKSTAIARMSESKFYNPQSAEKMLVSMHGKGLISEVSEGVFKKV